MLAIGYVRISKLDQETTSPQRQRQAIAKLCRERGWELVRTYEDLDLSAFNRKVRRPGFEQMMGRLGECDAIVFWRIDRLSRSVGDFDAILRSCQEAGVKLVSTDHNIDTSTAMGKAFVQISSVFAELESGTLSERSRQMIAHKQGNGEWIGRVPFGFRRNGKGLELDPDRFALLKQAARRYVGGESLRRIAPDLGMTHPSLSKRLKTDRVLNSLPRPLATSLAQAMNERGRTGTRAKRSLLGGLARCGICGEGMTVVADDRGREGRKPFASYSCKERAHASISKPWLDQHVTEAVIAAIDTGKLIKRLERRGRNPSKAMASSEIEARLEILETDFYEKGLIPRDRYLSRREGLLRRLASAREAEQDHGIDLPRELAEHLAERWADFTSNEQRRIIATCMESITVTKATGHGPVDPGRVAIAWR
jgi:DNA invertase Pin-like site-specific DNA recombinase